MRRSCFLLVCLISLFFHSCRMPDSRFAVRILSRKPLPELLSGSALCLYGDRVFTVSDNATAVYRCDTAFLDCEKIALKGYEGHGTVIPKPQKHDLEAAVIADVKGQPTLLAFGSGSLSPQRDGLLVLPCAAPGQQQFISLTGFYEHLRKASGIAPAAFNIEAAITAGDKLYLMNRGTNTVFRTRLDDFLRWMDAGGILPEVQYQQLSLPVAGKREAGFSGACLVDEKHILFCASVEDTDNWIDDGAVLGSFVGLLTIAGDGSLSLKEVRALQNPDGSNNTDKPEGILILPGTGADKREVIAIADNDALGSVLLRLEISW